jgi:hypothetical protein
MFGLQTRRPSQFLRKSLIWWVVNSNSINPVLFFHFIQNPPPFQRAKRENPPITGNIGIGPPRGITFPATNGVDYPIKTLSPYHAKNNNRSKT